MTEEQFTDSDGNLVTRKVTQPHRFCTPHTLTWGGGASLSSPSRLFTQVIRKVVRRVVGSERKDAVGEKSGAVDAVAPSGGAGVGKGKRRGKRSRQGHKVAVVVSLRDVACVCVCVRILCSSNVMLGMLAFRVGPKMHADLHR